MSTALDNVGRRHIPTAQHVGQVTAVEQARAVAEVAAAVQVAQQFPRDMDRVRRDMQAACSSMALARKAFYAAIPNVGPGGSSVHLARELARIYGNFQSGVHELNRDDDRQQSEIQAFAWDVETNGRASRTFIVPHQRMKSGQRVPIIDLGDVYRNNQNIGARALRECIFNSMPDWLVEEAENACRATLEAGNGKPLGDRIRDALTAFVGLGVVEQRLVDRVGKPSTAWTAQDLATLEIAFLSIRRGETTADEQFPPPRVTAEEIRKPRPPKQERLPREPDEDAPAESAAEVGEGQTVIGDEPPEGFRGEPVDPDLRGKAR